MRQVLSADGLKLPSAFTPGFAPPEMHINRSLLATVYACFAGVAPPPADTRLVEDVLVPASRALASKYAPELLAAGDWCLELDYLRRPQSVLARQKVLLGEDRRS